MKVRGRLPTWEYCHKHGLLADRGAGTYTLGELVWVRGREKWHTGKIVEVVPRAMYPRSNWKGLRVRGYYRETETYIVDVLGLGYRWPRVGNLSPINYGYPQDVT